LGTLGNQHLPFDPVRTSGLPKDAERFSGDNSTTDFELSYVVHSTTDIAVFVDNVRQEPTTAYNVVGKTVEFTEAPPTGTNNIYVVFNHANPEIFGSVPDGSIGLDKLADTNFLQKRNIVINGGMNVWQRKTTQAGITTSDYYTVDRWQTSIDTLGTWTQSRSTDVPSGQGFGYSLKMDCTTANASPAAGNYMLLQTKFEGQDLQYLKKGTTKAESVTVSFWVKSNKTGTYIVELFDQDNTRQISKSYTINVASTWEKKTLTFSGDTTGAFGNDNGDSLNLVFWLGAGSTYTGGTLNTAWASNTNANRAVGQVNLADNTANEWFVTGIQMETGTYASPFEFEKYSDVLRKCQRYFYFWLFPNSSNGFNDSYQVLNGFNFHPISFPTTMRVAPSVTADLSTDWSTLNTSQHVIQIGSKNIAYHKIRAQATGRFYALYTGTTNGAEFDAEL